MALNYNLLTIIIKPNKSIRATIEYGFAKLIVQPNQLILFGGKIRLSSRLK